MRAIIQYSSKKRPVGDTSNVLSEYYLNGGHHSCKSHIKMPLQTFWLVSFEKALKCIPVQNYRTEFLDNASWKAQCKCVKLVAPPLSNS